MKAYPFQPPNRRARHQAGMDVYTSRMLICLTIENQGAMEYGTGTMLKVWAASMICASTSSSGQSRAYASATPVFYIHCNVNDFGCRKRARRDHRTRRMLSAVELAERLKSRFAIVLRPSWVQDCLAHLNAKHAAEINSWSEDKIAQAAFAQFLLCDLNVAGAAALPPGVQVRQWAGQACQMRVVPCSPGIPLDG